MTDPNTTYRLSKPPQTLDELGDSLLLLEQLQTDLSKIEARFPPLHEQFAILEKYEVAISDEVNMNHHLYVCLPIITQTLLCSLKQTAKNIKNLGLPHSKFCLIVLINKLKQK